MLDCQSLWLKGLNLIQRNQIEGGLEVWNSCLEQGGRDPMLIFNYALELEKQGESIRSLQLLEMATRDHIYHPQLLNLKQWLIAQNDFPANISPLAWLDHSPDELVPWWLFIGIILLSLRFICQSEMLGNWASKLWFKMINTGFSVILSMTLLLVSLQIGWNLYGDWLYYKNPTVLVAANSSIFQQPMGNETLQDVLSGQKGELEVASDLEMIPKLWPFQKLKKIQAEDRKRVKVRFSSGQSGYLWADKLLPLEVRNE